MPKKFLTVFLVVSFSSLWSIIFWHSLSEYEVAVQAKLTFIMIILCLIYEKVSE